MNIVYENGQIVDAQLGDPILQQRMTLSERMAIFGCAQPNATVLTELNKLERLGTGSRAALVGAMVSEGLITSQRGEEILA